VLLVQFFGNVAPIDDSSEGVPRIVPEGVRLQLVALDVGADPVFECRDELLIDKPRFVCRSLIDGKNFAPLEVFDAADGVEPSLGLPFLRVIILDVVLYADQALRFNTTLCLLISIQRDGVLPGAELVGHVR